VTVSGAPVDPAIISSQLKGTQSRKQPSPKPEDAKKPSTVTNKSSTANAELKQTDQKLETKTDIGKPEAKVAVDSKAPESARVIEKTTTPLRPSAATSRTISPQVKEGAPSATSTVERDVLKEFKTFANQQRINAEKARTSKAKADKEVKLTELKKFADTFKLSTPVPNDLISIIAKDPVKQKEIQAKALQNAEDVAKAKADAGSKDKETPPKESSTKPTPEQVQVQGQTPTDSRTPARPTAPNATSPSNLPNRHPASRQSYAPPQYHSQSYRGDRAGSQHITPQNRPTGHLAQRLRGVEQQKLSQSAINHQHMGVQDLRPPPTGPANNSDPSYNRRMSGVPSHIGGKLNPNSHEFRPSPYAASFNPNGHPSAGSSPRSAVNNVADGQTGSGASGQLIRRKTKVVDVKKCYILAHVKTILPPQGRNWDENAGLRPSYDTLPTWRQLQEGSEKSDSTMHLTYKEYFERHSPFVGPTIATPNPSHVMPQIAHQHQLPFHLQHGAQHLGPRQSPHIPPMQMHASQHGHVAHLPFNGGDDHRMMHSNSAQSFASPRMAQVPMAYPPAMSSPAPVPYNQPVMQPYVGPGTPSMAPFRSFSNNPQYIPQQPTHMAAPMIIQPQFITTAPQGMVTAPQMQMYPTAGHPQFIPPGAAPPQPMPGTNGYPSPGRPTAPMMVHQGSQQGQPVYGMSPSVQYQQPVFTPQQGAGQSKLKSDFIPSTLRLMLTLGSYSSQSWLYEYRPTAIRNKPTANAAIHTTTSCWWRQLC
jgi:hypothetical protein